MKPEQTQSRLREAAPTHHTQKVLHLSSFFFVFGKDEEEEEKQASKKSNKTADKNIKLHHATAEMGAAEEEDTTRYDILARASQFYCRASTIAVFFSPVCARARLRCAVCASRKKKLSA